jgi:hypothetical protein
MSHGAHMRRPPASSLKEARARRVAIAHAMRRVGPTGRAWLRSGLARRLLFLITVLVVLVLVVLVVLVLVLVLLAVGDVALVALVSFGLELSKPGRHPWCDWLTGVLLGSGAIEHCLDRINGRVQQLPRRHEGEG